MQQNFSTAYIADAVESSLRRLQTDYIDIYQLHSPPTVDLRRDDVVETLERLKEQGKIRYWGIACEEPEDVLLALDHPQLDAVQVSISALEQAALDQAIPSAAARQVGVIGRQVFASGLLTRSMQDLDTRSLDADPTIADRKKQQLERFASLAWRRGDVQPTWRSSSQWPPRASRLPSWASHVCRSSMRHCAECVHHH
jgi:aryl-alcohol dehydrogenase-like predicted oxidoreductase